MKDRAPARFVMITGLAGSGKSTALRALEDMGFYSVDNLPARLFPAFLELTLQEQESSLKTALVMDLRSPRFAESFPQIHQELTRRGCAFDLLFLEAQDQVLIRRYSQTRRLHPLARQADDSLAQAIARERELLRPVRARATQVLDTGSFNVHGLRRQLFELFSQVAPPARLQVNLVSFGFKYGLPGEADMVMDVRFLPNPYFVDNLRELDGTDQAVVDYVHRHGDTTDFLIRFKELLNFLIPRFLEEGKSRLTIAIGCTGGRHRSVVVSRWLAQVLDVPGCRFSLRHRDLNRG